MTDLAEHRKKADSQRSPEIERVLHALLFLTVSALEDATDDDLRQMSHTIELIQKEINLRYFIKVDRTKVPSQWFSDCLKNSRHDCVPKFGGGGSDDKDH